MYPLRNVLCATDLSDAAAEAIAQAAELAARDRARLVVAHVLAAPAAIPTTGVEVAPPIVDPEELAAAAQDGLDRQVSASPAASFAGRELIRATESIHAEILRRAEALAADLVVLASHKHSTLERILLGSTAKEVVRHVHRPVLVARKRGSRGTVVAGTDLSPHSLPALRAAAEEARRRQAELLVVHCVELPSPVVSLGGAAVVPPPPEDPRSPQALRRAAEERLTAFLQQAEVRARPLIAEGPARAALVTAAEESRCELLVVGTSSKTGLKRVLLGSVAEAVVAKAPCSVLTVPGTRT
jgi:nucleotide-binding universal stress UspA family protein